MKSLSHCPAESRKPNNMLHRRITEGINGDRFLFPRGIRLRVVALLFSLIMAAVASAATDGADSNPDVDDLGDQQALTTAGLIKTNADSMPELTTVDAVLRLSPEEAQLGYPVNIRGVVTCIVQVHN